VPHDIVVELGCINQIFTGFEVWFQHTPRLSSSLVRCSRKNPRSGYLESVDLGVSSPIAMSLPWASILEL
jgi:hypothetical protein